MYSIQHICIHLTIYTQFYFYLYICICIIYTTIFVMKYIKLN